MMKTLKLGPLTVTCAIQRVKRVEGFISRLDTTPEKHIIMWDFDDVTRRQVRDALWDVMERLRLPDVYFWHTGRDGSYHAVCLDPFDFSDVIHALMLTRHVEPAYIALSVMRGYCTLRYTPKGNERPAGLEVLLGSRRPALKFADIKRGVTYVTAKL